MCPDSDIVQKIEGLGPELIGDELKVEGTKHLDPLLDLILSIKRN